MRSQLTEAEASFIRWERVGRFATRDPDGAPHVVPVCPVLDGDVLVFASDPTAKIRHLRTEARCALIFDDYVEDWNLNRQVQVRGTATIVEEGPQWDRAKVLLDEKYPQYEPMFPIRPGEGVMVFVRIDRVTSEGF
jgi:nitroimidazol reductase NimA-like FMN-containing flavoprotein (pyridoxamine 5'-phosphate oxidase superfamily)